VGSEECIQLYTVGLKMSRQTSAVEMSQEQTQRILSALNDLKARLEEIFPLLMGGRDIRRAAADSRASTQGQRSDTEGRRAEHERHRWNDESQSRCVPQNTEHDSEQLCESVSTSPVMDQPSVSPGTEVEDNGSEPSAKRCCECSEGKDADDAQLSVDMNPSATADYEQRVQNLELKGEVLCSNCACTKRNGLQTDCERLLCRGHE
jgi:hypothetical protein